MKSTQAGFTLIELVIVIVILGILSAFALPRFADLGGDARASAIEGAAGAMNSASSIVFSACQVSSDCDPSLDASAGGDPQVDLEGESIDVAFGYPAATDAGIQEAAQISDDDYVVDTSGDDFVLQAEGAADESQCQVTYSPATESSSPDVTVVTDQC